MIKFSSSKLISTILKLLILLVIAKGLMLALWFYLPSDGVELKQKYNFQPKYQRVDFKNMIDEKKKKKKSTSTTQDGINMTNMVLKGVYGNKEKAFVIVAMKKKSKDTEIIGIGEEFKGYKLKSITISSAIFEKNSKAYILKLEDKSSLKKGAKNNKNFIRKAKVTKKQSSSDSVVNVAREDIKHFADNPKQIWKEISIGEVKKDGEIIGFKVNRIDKKSKFAMLGLKKGDLIVKANNVYLHSYKDAIDIYQNIGKLDTIQIVVLRDNEEVELVYEIR